MAGLPPEIEEMLAQLARGASPGAYPARVPNMPRMNDKPIYPEQYPGGPMPGTLPPSGPLPGTLPPSGPLPGAGTMPQSTSDEDVLGAVSDQMGGSVSEWRATGDLANDQQDLIDIYNDGDPADPAVRARWAAAKDSFIDVHGEQNLPDLPNDPDTGGTEDYGAAESESQYAYEQNERDLQSKDAYETLRKRGRGNRTVVG